MLRKMMEQRNKDDQPKLKQAAEMDVEANPTSRNNELDQDWNMEPMSRAPK